MKQIFSDVIQFRGTHFDFGFFQGKQLKGSLTIENREKQWKRRKPRFTVNLTETKEALSVFTPWIWDELLGLQEALEWSMDEVLQEFSGYRLEYKRSGCSILTSQDYMIRNYDYHPKTYEGRFMMFQPTDHGYANIGPSQRITGRMDGMNEQGLTIGYNFMNRRKPGDGFICNMIARMVLECCATVSEAVSMLKDIPHRHSFSYIVLDRWGETKIVEATPRAIDVRQSHICTNHFEILKDENRFHLDDSYKRMHAIASQATNNLDPRQAFRLLNDTDKGVFSDQYKNWAGTIHTSVYFPKERKVWFALGGDRTPVVFDFDNWLEGKDSRIKRILGEVNTDVPFLHMDKRAR